MVANNGRELVSSIVLGSFCPQDGSRVAQSITRELEVQAGRTRAIEVAVCLEKSGQFGHSRGGQKVQLVSRATRRADKPQIDQKGNTNLGPNCPQGRPHPRQPLAQTRAQVGRKRVHLGATLWAHAIGRLD